MAFVIADRVRETTTTTGTGTITLGGAVTNFETFTANLSNSDTTYYAIVDNTNGAFEVGLGTFTASGTTLARSVIASSNSNNLVDFGAGTKDVFITVPASKIVVEDGSNNVAIGGTVTATAFSGSGAGLTGVDVVNDSTPQLGGDLDAQNNDIENAGLVEAKADAGIYGSSSSPVEFTVTVASKTSGHPYSGDGSGNAYFINGIESPAITLHGVDSTTANSEYHYRFTLSSSDMSSHPFRLYLDAGKTTAYTTGVTTTLPVPFGARSMSAFEVVTISLPFISKLPPSCGEVSFTTSTPVRLAPLPLKAVAVTVPPMETLLLPSSTTILLAGIVINTSFVPAPKSTRLLLLELAITDRANVVPEAVNVPRPTSKALLVLSTIA